MPNYDDDGYMLDAADDTLHSDDLPFDIDNSVEDNKAIKKRAKFIGVLERFVDKIFELVLHRAETVEEVPEDYPERWLFKGDPVANGERRDVANSLSSLSVPYAKYTAVVYLLTFKQLLEEYTIDGAFLKYGHHKPPMRTKVEVNLDVEVEVFTQGFFNLVNPQTDERITVSMDDEKLFVTGLKKTGEAEIFEKAYTDRLEANDVFRGKTFTFTPQLHPKFVTPSDVKRTDVILDDKIWKQLDINAINVFRRNAEYKKKQIPTKRGIILEGPPGNGKSMVVKYLENELRGEVTFIYVTDGLVSGGGSVSRIFDMAQHYSPCVLIFEDVDSIGSSRDFGGSSITPELLSRLDGLEKLEDFVIIATTNYPEKIDDALRNRPNRFDRRIRIKRPEGQSSLRLLKKFLELKNLSLFSDVELKTIENKLGSFSGAQIGEVVVTAQMISMYSETEFSIDHLDEAAEFMKENYYDDAKIGKDESKKKVGFRP